MSGPDLCRRETGKGPCVRPRGHDDGCLQPPANPDHRSPAPAPPKRPLDQRGRPQRLAVAAVLAERDEQDLRYPGRTCAEIADELSCLAILTEEVGEVAKEVVELTLGPLVESPAKKRELLRAELVQVAAVSLAWMERLS